MLNNWAFHLKKLRMNRTQNCNVWMNNETYKRLLTKEYRRKIGYLFPKNFSYKICCK